MKRRVVVGCAATALLTGGGVTGLASLSALSAAQSLARAEASLTEAGGTPAQALPALVRARTDLERAEQELERWPVDLVAAVPVLGRSWRAERAVSRTAAEVVSATTVLADAVPSLRPLAGGVDLTALERLHGQLEEPVRRSRSALAALRSTPVSLTPRPVQDGVRSAEDALGTAVGVLQRLHVGLGVLPGVLGSDRPRTLLVMLQNNAELRGAGGYASSFATGRLEDGRITLEPLRDVLDVADPPERARRVPAPQEFVEDYGQHAGDTTIWRSWNMSPHVPDSAAVAARVAAALLPVEPDVVLLLDVPAMGALAALGGQGVPLPNGTTVQPEELTQALLVDTYADAGVDLEEQVQRRRDLQSAATASVTRLLSGGVPPVDAARALARLAAGRHLSLWSAVPQEQRGLVRIGAAGAVAPRSGDSDLFHLSVNNIGSNKLDLYVPRELSVDVTVAEDVARVVQRVELSNRAPEGLVPYVAGYEREGLLRSRVELSLPPAAADVVASVDGGPWEGALRRGASRQRLALRLELRREESVQLEVAYTLPLADGRYDLRLVPQALATDEELTLTLRSVSGRALVTPDGPTERPLRRTLALDSVHDVEAELVPESRWQELRQRWSGGA